MDTNVNLSSHFNTFPSSDILTPTPSPLRASETYWAGFDDIPLTDASTTFYNDTVFAEELVSTLGEDTVVQTSLYPVLEVLPSVVAEEALIAIPELAVLAGVAFAGYKIFQWLETRYPSPAKTQVHAAPMANLPGWAGAVPYARDALLPEVRAYLPRRRR